MSVPNTIQSKVLAKPRLQLEFLLGGTRGEDRNVRRLQLLEACAAAIGSWNYHDYLRVTGFSGIPSTPRGLDKLVHDLRDLPMHPSMALSILATSDLPHEDRRARGSYYTDFRLAAHLADALHLFPTGNGKPPSVVDPAVGTGILLVAAAITLSKRGYNLDTLLSHAIYGVDFSPVAIRGALLALSSLTCNLQVIQALAGHIRQADSLTAQPTFWSDLHSGAFDIAIGNPPWEKLKLTVHEHVRATRLNHHYGSELISIPDAHALGAKRQRLKDYADKALSNTAHQGQGEPDLYKLFLELAQRLVRPGGVIAMLVPAGLIRSQGTEHLRRSILSNSEEIALEIFDNKARFFTIDTRFKFLTLVTKQKVTRNLRTLHLAHSHGQNDGVVAGPSVPIPLTRLQSFRPDLSVPEVRSDPEWRLFSKIAALHGRFGCSDSGWAHRFYREVDMTMDKRHFTRAPNIAATRPNLLPVIEGRMVHQFQFGAKSYISGSGRSALWNSSQAASVAQVRPQYLIDPSFLKVDILTRARKQRAGFCDITGQTNERTMLAALIPSDAVCGNKVPTIEFHNESRSPDLPFVWLGLANSFVFDWVLRRLVTTTVNFFILDSLPIPSPDSCGKEMATLARRLALRELKEGTREYAEARAKLDALATEAYDITPKEFDIILEDFDLLDRGQPVIHGESRSTITKDLTRLAVAQRRGLPNSHLSVLQARVQAAADDGACAYVPSQWGRILRDEHSDHVAHIA